MSDSGSLEAMTHSGPDLSSNLFLELLLDPDEDLEILHEQVEHFESDDERILAPTPHLEDDEGTFGDSEEVLVGTNRSSWEIKHERGDHKFHAQEFIAAIQTPSFNANQALEMLQRRYTMDYGSKRAGSRPASVDDEYFCTVYLDLIIVIGQPLQPLSQSSTFFDNVTVSFKNWGAPYSAKHTHGLGFDLEHRTFRVATGATRESWFIVMHPVANAPEELRTRGERRRRHTKLSGSSALQSHHAHFLAAFIKGVFLSGELLGQGVEPSWRLGGPHSKNITFDKWSMFQAVFMRNWPEHVRNHAQDPFWVMNEPAFHAYDYGANIEIPFDAQLQALPKETRLRVVEEDLDGSDLEGESDDRATDASGRSPPPTQPDYDSLFVGSFRQLRTELGKYIIENIETVTYAVAVDIHCLDGRSPDPEAKLYRTLLADRHAVFREYKSHRDFTFYPLAFHPAYGNFSSPRPPAFLKNHVLTTAQDNMRFQNDGAHVLSYGYFQAYADLKRSIRHSPDDLLATKGVATAALALSTKDNSLSPNVTAKRDRLLHHLQGKHTPEDPESSRPFFRERKRIVQAIEEEELAYRMEQVFSVQVSRLKGENRSFGTILRPIFQLMRFFLEEPQHYTHLFRSFRPSIFPGVLASFSTLFAQGLDGMLMRYQAAGIEGLGVALAEGVAALDRLGSYCFTGFPKSLMESVFHPLGTIDSLEYGGWPFIDPQMLDLQGTGSLSLSTWPRIDNGRPILMHIASLAFHYGPNVASSRHSELWFGELGGLTVQGPSDAARFVIEVLQDLWKPQMIAFIKRHFQRASNQGSRSRVTGQETLQTLEEQRAQVERWSQTERPFSWAEYETVFPLLASESRREAMSYQTRHDFAVELYTKCMDANRNAGTCFHSNNATWYTVLRAAVKHTTGRFMNKEEWIGVLTSAMLSCDLECMPGSYRSKLSYRRVVRLVGSALSVKAIAARPGSLKRAAIDAEQEAKRPRLAGKIDFGCSVPFSRIPPLIQEGFAQQEKLFHKGDRKILEHYQTACIVLAESLGDPLCDLMLVLALTMAASSETPTVAQHAHCFSVGPKKANSIFAANLVTRMLWFLKPKRFPWDADTNSVLRVPEMTKKIEHKGVSNRLLRELGWIQVIRGKRDTPRNSEIELQDSAELISRRRVLFSLMKKDAGSFIAAVFRSGDGIWVERCASIIAYPD